LLHHIIMCLLRTYTILQCILIFFI
jgi:hypothetical protein